jgi:LPXTG-site transpeptidase (sortase) family protein
MPHNYSSEIYKLLKLGPNAPKSQDDPDKKGEKQEQEGQEHDAPVLRRQISPSSFPKGHPAYIPEDLPVVDLALKDTDSLADQVVGNIIGSSADIDGMTVYPGKVPGRPTKSLKTAKEPAAAPASQDDRPFMAFDPSPVLENEEEELEYPKRSFPERTSVLDEEFLVSDLVSEEARMSGDQMFLFQTLKRKPEEKSRQAQSSRAGKRINAYLLYPMVFVVSFAFFYVLLNFSSLVGQVQALFTKPEEETILQEDLRPYYAWINGYFFAVQDRTLLEPNNDIDKDGLTNLDEFYLRTNPTLADSDGDGIPDGVEVISGTNFWGSGPMTEKQRKLLEKIDLIKVNNRINYNTASLVDHSENPGSKIEFDLNKTGLLSIPKLQLQVPLIFSKSPDDFDKDLTRGVIHYPGTALPGGQGIMYVSGHSSDYLWKRHDYKQVFARINALAEGDDIFIDAYGVDGKLYNFRYKVTTKNIYKPDDQRQFLDDSSAKLNLSTCWPIGTQKDRYVVTSVLTPL